MQYNEVLLCFSTDIKKTYFHDRVYRRQVSSDFLFMDNGPSAIISSEEIKDVTERFITNLDLYLSILEDIILLGYSTLS